jgi:hypothetical protein
MSVVRERVWQKKEGRLEQTNSRYESTIVRNKRRLTRNGREEERRIQKLELLERNARSLLLRLKKPGEGAMENGFYT